MSRRGLFAAAAVGLGVYGLSRFESAAAGPRLARLDAPGAALETADRVPPPTTTMTTTTTPTTNTVVVPPAPGELLFPIIVGPDDECLVLDNFGDCRGSGCSRLHEGLDIMADHLLAIRAPVAGRLTKRYEDYGSTSGAGNGWTLTDDVDDVVYKFFHMDHHEEGLEVDDEVEFGQIIGYVGNTGTSGTNTGTNYHLHFEYRPGNVAADPLGLLQRDPNVVFA